ncbi:MAG: prolipoprotein diacylglyceryl transferase [bacterium]|nr:prolipoprotein diacylglyceryl transferase [bacterium]
MKGLLLYALFNCLGIIAAWLVSRKLTFDEYEKLSPEKRSFMFMGMVIGVILGAKIPVIASYGLEPEFIITGKSIFGALVGGYIGSNLAKARYGIPGHYGDKYIIPLCVAVSIGKFGCLFNGCCGGVETGFFLGIQNHAGVPAHPVPVYTVVFHLILAVVFYILHKKRVLLTMHFVLYLMIYSTYRFLIEFIRTEPKIVYGYSVYQVMGFFGMGYFTMVLLYRIYTGSKENYRERVDAETVS